MINVTCVQASIAIQLMWCPFNSLVKATGTYLGSSITTVCLDIFNFSAAIIKSGSRLTLNILVRSRRKNENPYFLDLHISIDELKLYMQVWNLVWRLRLSEHLLSHNSCGMWRSEFSWGNLYFMANNGFFLNLVILNCQKVWLLLF